MKSVEQLIGDLLLRHNCVIVPEFGGFVAKQIAAKIDYEKGQMSPPKKSVLFNKQLINSDGLLINEYARSNDVSFDNAAEEVSQKVKNWNNQLNNGLRIELDRVGHIYLDQEQNLCFEQDRFFNLLLESFGLGNVHFISEEDVEIVRHKVKQIDFLVPESQTTNEPHDEERVETPVIVMNAVEQSEEIPSEEKHQENVVPVVTQKRRPWKYIAAACLLPIAFYSVWIPMKTNVLESGLISIRDFNPFHQVEEGKYEQLQLEAIDQTKEDQETFEDQANSVPEEFNVITYKYDETLFVKVRRSSEEGEQPIVEAESEIPEIVSPEASHYIVGCFGNEENAINLVETLKSEGMSALIVDVKNGLHRVSAGAALSQESLSAIKQKSESLGFNGWVLK